MTTLYELSVESFDRVLTSTLVVMKKAAEHFDAQGDNPDDLLALRFAEDMWPLSLQLNSVRHHSLNAIKGILAGEFNPPQPPPQMSYVEWMNYLAGTLDELRGFGEAEIEAASGKPMYFRMLGVEMPFSTDNFILSFSTPNLYFHATTVYDLLRMQGAPLGKRDFLSVLKLGLP